MKFIFGLIVGFLIFPIFCDVVNTWDWMSHSELSSKFSSFALLPTYGLGRSISGQCTKDVSKNGHGWVFVRRDFYKCYEWQIHISDLIYGEYTKPVDPKLKKRVCNNCTM